MSLFAQPELQPALRWLLCGLICLSGGLWSGRRWGFSTALFLLAQGIGIVFWTAQLHGPIGLDTREAAQDFWARVGVASTSGNARQGYVSGTTGSATAFTQLAAAGAEAEFLQRSAAWSPLVLMLALSLLCASVQGSRPRRLLTAAMASTAAPLFGLQGDGPATPLVHPEAAWVSGLIVLCLAAGLRIGGLTPRPRVLALLTLASFALGQGLSSEGFLEFMGDWTVFAAAPLAALLLVPALRIFALALRTPGFKRTSLEALILVFAGCGSSWFWWEPTRTIPDFELAVSGTPALSRPLEWIRANTPKSAIIAAPPEYSALIAAATGRQGLVPSGGKSRVVDQSSRRLRLLASLRRGQPDAALVLRFAVTHLFLGPGDPDPSASPADGSKVSEGRSALRCVYADGHDFRVFVTVPQ